MANEISITFELEAHCLRCKRAVDLDTILGDASKVPRQLSTNSAVVLELEADACPQCSGVRYVVSLVM